ncbi:hypothetical protein Tco_0223906 [Tanacetum coccineum]
MNSRYNALVASNARLQEKINRKVGHFAELRAEVFDLSEKHEKVQQDCHVLDQEKKNLRSLCDASSDEVERLREQLAKAEAAGAKSADELVRTNTKLSDQALAMRDLESKLVLEESESRKYRDMVVAAKQQFDVLWSDITRFINSDLEGLVRKLLSRDEFNVTLAHILSLSITFVVKKGLRMRHTEAEFEEAYQNVSNFFLGVQAKFDEAIIALPSTHFPFLVKISEAAESALSEVASIQPDKVVRPAVLASAPAMSFSAGETFGWTSTLKDSRLIGLAHDASPSLAKLIALLAPPRMP